MKEGPERDKIMYDAKVKMMFASKMGELSEGGTAAEGGAAGATDGGGAQGSQ